MLRATGAPCAPRSCAWRTPPTRQGRVRRGDSERSRTSSTSAPITRYVVRLEDGGALGVLAQNLAQTSTEVRAAQGRPVQVVWHGAHAVAITTPRGEEETGMKKRIAVVALGDGRRCSPRPSPPTAKPSGKRASGVLKVVAWEGYTENQWVKPFEKSSGCTIQRQVRRQLGRDGTTS